MISERLMVPIGGDVTSGHPGQLLRQRLGDGKSVVRRRHVGNGDFPFAGEPIAMVRQQEGVQPANGFVQRALLVLSYYDQFRSQGSGGIWVKIHGFILVNSSPSSLQRSWEFHQSLR